MDKSRSVLDHLRSEELALAGWMKSLGTGLLAGAAFVAVAFMVENKVIKAGAKLFGK